ncbi:anthranilate synthase component I [Steroidobacter denitrificans]|uniref:Anthranilate synthase component 1 n=1 Tax=Steroidobacter denitrificans TaxID=465721 RepID=A0A127FER5_STEDE|nr:anthranilate synthase component I family protein [Steroidobacter denitrificans]AMN48358.1 anthranilate synthase component I [Steroidobacter denitrificans]
MKPPFDIAADLDTPVSAYLKLKPFKPRFLLESVEGGEHLGRYSFIGFGDCLEIRLDERGLTVDGRTRPAPPTSAGLLDALRTALADAPQLQPQIPGVPLPGGLVGVAGYDLVRRFERLPARRAGSASTDGATPEAHYLAPRSLLVFDHLTRGVALLHAGSEAERIALRREVIQALRGPLPAPRSRISYSPALGSLSEAQFIDGVHRVKEYIAAGDVYQLVLSVRFAGRCELEPFEAYRALRLLNPSPYLFYCDLGDSVVVGSSPEALVKLSGGRASLRPIAGTRPRGQDDEQDARLEQELLADPKENAEHVMLVDLARNDLGRVATAGSIEVSPYRSIERYSHVMHIVSGVNGELMQGKDAFDLFAAAFPAGTLVGAPKVRAMQIIDELEPVGRGFYGGTVGYFGHGGDMDQAITIRTMVFRGDTYSFQAGAGIVADSVAATEYQEVMAKSAIVRRALSLVEEGL